MTYEKVSISIPVHVCESVCSILVHLFVLTINYNSDFGHNEYYFV
jgi:hypothetical protein